MERITQNIMRSDMKIRQAKRTSYPAIAALQIANWRRNYKGLLSDDFLDGLEPGSIIDELREHELIEHGGILICEDNNELLGFAEYRPDDEIQDCMYLESLHVRESAQGRGIGTRLIQAVFNEARSSGMRSASVCIVQGNERARQMYVSLGAETYKYFTDDFHGTESRSEKLIWKELHE